MKHKIFRLATLILSAALCSCTSVVPPAASASTGDSKIFSERAQDLLARCAAIPAAKKGDYQILDETYRITYDAAGGYETSSHVTLRILTSEGVNIWSIINAGWQPWRESRPVIEARVITATGAEFALNPAAVVDTGKQDDSSNLRSDSRQVSAPIPKLEVGSILEYRLTERGREARAGAGAGQAVFIGRKAAVERKTIIIEAPESLPLHWTVAGKIQQEVGRKTAEGRVQVTLAFPRLDYPETIESFLPPDVPPLPIFYCGTAGSWNALARIYAEASEPYLDPEPVRAWALDALAGTDPKRDPAKAARLIADAVKRKIRYTGVNFGENAIIPHKPTDTIAAGYGDCKDQASLLAACLRAVGIEANLALLKAGTGLDADLRIPSLEFFNHVIVRLPALDLWIDPTATYTPTGSLPEVDQGRQTLVIAPATTSLVPTPKSTGADNWALKVIEAELSESGKTTTVVERFSAGGLIEQRYRSYFDEASRAERIEGLEKYGVSHYDAEKATAEFSNPLDLAKNFTLTVTASGSEIGNTDDEAASCVMRAGDLFEFVPDGLEIRKEKPAARKEDVHLTIPHRTTLEYRVLAPSGFRARALPENFSLDLGPAVLSGAHFSEDQHRIKAVYSLEFKTGRFSAADLEKLRKEARAFLDSNAKVAYFENIGKALSNEGRHREALAEFRRLQALHPSEPLHRMQASDVLREAGFTKDALAEAEAAVALDPKSAIAHRNLAFICLNDPFGRQFGEGADIERASAEYAKAFELDGKDYTSLFNCGIIREFAADGTFRGEGARLKEAVEIFERAPDQIERYNNADRYLGDLFFLGRYADVMKAGAALKDRKKGAQFQIAAAAAAEGTAAAEKMAASVYTNAADRRSAFQAAGTALIGARRYAQAADLLLAAARGTSSYASVNDYAQKIKVLKPREKDRTADGAEGLIVRLFDSILFKKDLDETIFAPEIRKSIKTEALFSNFEEVRRSIFRNLSKQGFSRENIMDIISAYLVVETGKSGAASLGKASLPELNGESSFTFCVVEENGKPYILDIGGFSKVGSRILKLVEENKLEEARDWALTAMNPGKTLASFPQQLPAAFQDVFPADPKSADELTLAGAILCATEDSGEFPAKALERMLAAVRTETDRKRKDSLVFMAMRLSVAAKSDERHQAVPRYLESVSDIVGATREAAGALMKAGLKDEAEAVARAGLQRQPQDPDLRRMLSSVLMKEGKTDEVVSITRDLVALGSATLMDINNGAWAMLFSKAPDFRIIGDWGIARRVGDDDTASLHTLACLLGAAGRYEEALAAFRKFLDSGASREAGADLWVAYGLLARSFGLKERANESFAQTVGKEDPANPVGSAYLARRWETRP